MEKRNNFIFDVLNWKGSSLNSTGINIHILFNFTKLFIWKGINNEIFNHWICKVDKDRRRRPTTSKTIINKSDGKELISFLKQGIVDLNPSCKKYSKEMSNSINIQVSKYTLSKQTRGAPPSPLQVSSGPYNIWELVFKNKTIHMFKLLVFFLFSSFEPNRLNYN